MNRPKLDKLKRNKPIKYTCFFVTSKIANLIRLYRNLPIRLFHITVSMLPCNSDTVVWFDNFMLCLSVKKWPQLLKHQILENIKWFWYAFAIYTWLAKGIPMFESSCSHQEAGFMHLIWIHRSVSGVWHARMTLYGFDMLD